MTTDIADLIAGALMVSRGTAYDLMREALAKQYAEKNSLGGPAKVFDAMANAIRAGDDYHAVLRQYGYAEAQKQPVATVIQFDGEKIIDASMEFFDKYPIGTELYTSPPAQRKPLTDDPLQGAVDWLLEADGEYFCTATVQRTLRIGYNRAKRLCDTAKERAAHGIKGDA